MLKPEELEELQREVRPQRDVRQNGAREAIATSSGQNDSGMFELSFRGCEPHALHDDHRRRVTLEFPPTVREVLRLADGSHH